MSVEELFATLDSKGGNTAAINVDENSTAVTTVVATDDDDTDTLTYSISGGTDAQRFGIDATTGVLSFVEAPDYEDPKDTGSNNLYNVMTLMEDFEGKTERGKYYDTSAIYDGLCDLYGWDTEELFYFMKGMRDHSVNFLLEGLTREYPVSDLVQGCTAPLTTKINTGDVLRGNLYIDDLVTPIINWWQGPASGH